MKIIKFEGELFNNIDGYNKTLDLIEREYLGSDLAIVVPSNINTENTLSEVITNALRGDSDYLEKLQWLEENFLNLTRSLVPVQDQSSVLSFMKKKFNELEKFYKGIEILGECPSSTKESILCYGSILHSYLFASAGKARNIQLHWEDSRESLVAKVDESSGLIDTEYKIISISQSISNKKYHVFSGGICSDTNGKHVYIKIGGADITAASLSDLLSAKSIESWSLNKRIMTADSNLVSNAMVVSQLNYEEALELSNYDSTIMHPSALNTAMRLGIPIHIRSITHERENGTIISNDMFQSDDIIKGISNLNNICLLNIEGSGMIGVPGFSRKIFSNLNDAGINIILITQGASEHSICVGVNNQHAEKAKLLLDNIFQKEIDLGSIKPVMMESDLCIIALVGDQMKSHPGISGKMFSALGKNGINIRAIAQGSNERNISAVIKSTEIEKAVNVLHESFFGYSEKEINLFIAGTGNVGKKLINLLLNQSAKIESSQKLKIKLAGICNSRKMILSKQNLLSEQWQSLLERGNQSSIESFTDQMIKMNLRNSVLVDITANESIPAFYQTALSRSISVVACNKIAASGSLLKFNKLKETAIEYNSRFLFETNVGAALPIISTINDIIKSGDKIIRIDAVLSGTLNYVFNNYDGSKDFASIVRNAQAEGFTEPDPRLDLGGIDVMRKIMILARECGEPMEIGDVACVPFLPASCMVGTVDNFYDELEKNEDHFKKLYDSAKAENAKLKFVATYENGKAYAALKHIKQESEMYHLYGKDNIVLIKTERYNEQPLVIKGAGAGADVTASGVFADILRTIYK